MNEPKKNPIFEISSQQMENKSFSFGFGSQLQNLATVQNYAQSKMHSEKYENKIKWKIHNGGALSPSIDNDPQLLLL